MMGDSSGEVINSFITEKKIHTLKYKWTIKNFSFFTNEILTSSTFTSGLPEIDENWCLKINPKWVSNESQMSSLALWLRLTSLNKKPSFNAHYNISIVNSEKNEICIERSINPIQFSSTNNLISFSSFITRGKLFDPNLGYLPGDNLTIVCEIKIQTDNLTKNYFENQVDDENENINDKQSGEDLQQLLLSTRSEEELSDVTFHVGSNFFKENKNFLSARNPVFRRMFAEEKSLEKNNGKIFMDDITEGVFQEILHFIHTNEAPNIEIMTIELLKELLVQAKKFELDKLKNLCENVLFKKINFDNATQLLILAVTHEAGQLKKACAEFIHENAYDIVRTDDFKNLKRISRTLAALAKALSYSR